MRRASSVHATGTPIGGRTVAIVRDADGRDPPPPLVVAASLAALEGLLVLAYGVLEAAHIDADACGHGRDHGGCSSSCSALRSSPVAGNPAGPRLGPEPDRGRPGDGSWAGLELPRRRARPGCRSVLAVVAVVVLVGLLHPASVEALSATATHDVATRAAWSDRLLERRPQLVERAGQQPGDVHLADPDLGGDLRLRLVPEEAQQQDPLLPRLGRASSSGLMDSRISMCSSSSSSSPIVSSIETPPSSLSSVASRRAWSRRCWTRCPR